MPRLSLAFFTAATLSGLAGMIFGVVLGSTGDFTLSPVHAHLNLVGWASLAIMGTFYALVGGGGRLGWLNFTLSTAGLLVMIPSLAVYLSGSPAAEAGVVAGSIMAVLGMLVFVVAVLSRWNGAGRAAA